MKVTVYYKEVSKLVEKHYSVRPTIQRVDEKSLSIKYSPHKFIPSIHVVAHIESVSNEAIRISYESNKAVSLLISGALPHIVKAIPKGIKIDTESKQINVYPEKIAELKKVLSHLSLSGAQFTESGMELTLDIK